MDNFICCACKRGFETLKGLHLHIVKKEKVSLDDYYKLYFPRKDHLTGQLIDFRDHEQYFTSHFTSKTNMELWFRANYHSDKAKLLAQQIIKDRAERKKLTYAPSQVELRPVDSPSIVSFQKMFDYNGYCKHIGLKTRYSYGIIDNIAPLKPIKILIDTREQYPLEFESSEVKKLDVGDYTPAGTEYADVYVERKSVQDFYGTFFNTTNLERFTRELERAKTYGYYLIVVVEETLQQTLDYKTIFIKDKNFPILTFHNVRELMQKFDNVQFVFSYNRFTAKNLITRIFNQGRRAKELDWQYLVDSRQI
jgi:hypothetical protein